MLYWFWVLLPFHLTFHTTNLLWTSSAVTFCHGCITQHVPMPLHVINLAALTTALAFYCYWLQLPAHQRPNVWHCACTGGPHLIMLLSANGTEIWELACFAHIEGCVAKVFKQRIVCTGRAGCCHISIFLHEFLGLTNRTLKLTFFACQDTTMAIMLSTWLMGIVIVHKHWKTSVNVKHITSASQNLAHWQTACLAFVKSPNAAPGAAWNWWGRRCLQNLSEQVCLHDQVCYHWSALPVFSFYRWCCQHRRRRLQVLRRLCIETQLSPYVLTLGSRF